MVWLPWVFSRRQAKRQREAATTKKKVQWDLPPGAKGLIREIAAQEILQLETKSMLDQLKCSHAFAKLCRHNETLQESLFLCYHAKTTIPLVERFPGLCHQTLTLPIPRTKYLTVGTTKLPVAIHYQLGGGQDTVYFRRKQPSDPPHYSWSLLSLVCCLRPPVSLVKSIHECNVQALKTSRTDPICLDASHNCCFSCEPCNPEEELPCSPHPLHLACYCKASLDVVTYLVSQDPNSVNVGIASGHLPIHLALLANSPACEWLLGMTDPTVLKLSEIQARTTLLHCAAHGGVSLDLVRRVYEMNPEAILAPDVNQRSPLHCALSKEGTKEEVIAFLLQLEPASLEILDQHGEPCLLAAAMYHSVNVLEILLEEMEEPPLTDLYGNTLLHKAVQGNTVEVVQYLATRYPQLVKAKNDKGKTPLHCATGITYTPGLFEIKGRRTKPCCLETVKFLVEQYPDALFATDSGGRVPLRLAKVMVAPKSHYSLGPDGNAIVDYLRRKERDRDMLVVRVVPGVSGSMPTHYKIQRTRPLGRLFADYHKRRSGSQFTFYYRGKLLQQPPHDQTPESLGMESGDCIEAVASEVPETRITVSIQHSLVGEDGPLADLNIKILRRKQLGMAFRAYAVHNKVHRHELAFFFDRRQLDDSTTLAELGIEDGDCIHAATAAWKMT